MCVQPAIGSFGGLNLFITFCLELCRIVCIFAETIKYPTTMKALLIDPAKKTITEIEIEKGINAIYKAIDCSTFECPAVDFPNNDALYCDEEALLNPEKIEGGFMYPHWSYPIVGKALVLGTNLNTGDSVSVKTPAEVIGRNIIWVSKADALRWAANFQ
jgi:hypothetical protein